MANQSFSAYDDVLYRGGIFPYTHPDNLATLAALHGMKPARVDSCRVLELGCGEGANLIPMASTIPAGRFVGVDLAARPIAAGQASIQALGLTNVTLRQLDLMELGPAFGEFDYIITHGVYSWVPQAVQDKILEICRANLAPDGVAYVSYNTYPGGHLRAMVRDMMRYHVRHLTEPAERVGQARSLVKFLAESTPEPDVYRLVLKEELERLTEYPEYLLYHDDLAEINSPVYVHQFLDHAAQHGLQYVTEASFLDIQTGVFPAHVTNALRELAGDVIATEQYLDFLKCRCFRKTLLCHRAVELDRTLTSDKLTAFYVASPVHSTSPYPGICSRTVEEFRGPKGSAIKSDQPLIKAAFQYLSEVWPQSPHFGEVLGVARARLDRGSHLEESTEGEDARLLHDTLLRAYAAGVVELHVHTPPFLLKITARPVASPLARLQLQSGSMVTTLRHTSLKVEDALARQLLLMLDGTRDREALIHDLAGLIAGGVVDFRSGGEPIRDYRRARQLIQDGLEAKLNEIARLALLVG